MRKRRVGHHMETGDRQNVQALSAWHGAALRGALVPLNGLRTISTIAVMVSDDSVNLLRPGTLYLRVFIDAMTRSQPVPLISMTQPPPHCTVSDHSLQLCRCFITCACGVTLVKMP